MNIDYDWWDKFYADIERGYRAIGKPYLRPADWLERAEKAESNARKKVGNLKEGRSSLGGQYE